MKRTASKVVGSKNDPRAKAKISKLGRELRAISDKFFESGGKSLSRVQIEREVAERRVARSC